MGSRVESADEIIGTMRAAVPARQPQLDEAALRLLSDLTQELMAAKPGAVAEHDRFLAIGQRELCLPEPELASWLGGATVLVTGGTGCIGSNLMTQLAARGPAGEREPRDGGQLAEGGPGGLPAAGCPGPARPGPADR